MPQCYDWDASNQSARALSDVWVPCPVGLGCCIGTDTCLDHNICHVVNPADPSSDSSYSTYYVARCSDPTFTNPACQKVCLAPPDAVYNYTSQEWACCGQNTAGNVTCNDPTDEVFQAPAPASLAALSVGASIATTATLIPGSVKASIATSDSSTAASTTGTGTTQATPLQSHRSDTDTLSTGAKAGIGVGAGLGVLVIIAAIILTLKRYKKHSLARKSHAIKTYDHIVEKDTDRAYTGTNVNVSPVEVYAGHPPAYAHELDASR